MGGPVSIRLVVPVVLTCDHSQCSTEVTCSGELNEHSDENRSDLDGFLKAHVRLPEGWHMQYGLTYCPAHPWIR